MMKRVVSSVLSAGLLIGVMGFTAGCASSQSSATNEQAEQVEAEEEVSTGYGKVKRSNVTGAVSSVDVEETRRQRSPTNLAQLIEGNVAGVRVMQVSGGLRIQIRGVNSLNSGTDPLYIVDGMTVHPGPNGVLNDINPYDVKSITVLKGPEAALYGSRGSNGVVVIETK